MLIRELGFVSWGREVCRRSLAHVFVFHFGSFLFVWNSVCDIQPVLVRKFQPMCLASGIPNALNVISNVPFFIVGVIGLILCYYKNFFKLSLKGELCGWTFFYIGVAAVGFGSSYYHLKPDDATLVWDRLPMTIAFTSIIAIFIIERVDERKGTYSIIPLLLVGVERFFVFLHYIPDGKEMVVEHLRRPLPLFFDDLRPYAVVQFVPCIAIPVMAIILPPMYTHSTYWLWAAGFYLLAKVEEAADDTIYNWTHHIVSGHTLKHLCAAMVPVFLTLMLAKRDILPERVSLLQIWKISWTKYKENGVTTENETIAYTSVPFEESRE
ncbi:senescence associated protein [Tanacetum coccineum]